MAGNYPDPPSYRMAYDRDGTIVVKIVNGVPTQLTSQQVGYLNDESGATSFDWSSSSGSVVGLAFLFPEARDLDGYWYDAGANFGSVNPTAVEVSPNSTTGVDGTWTPITLAGVSALDVQTVPGFRSGIASVTSLGVRALRFTKTMAQNDYPQAASVHLYGEPSPGANPDRLELWHPTLDQKLPPAWLDWGNVPRSSSADRAFRVKNLSAALTANTPRVAMEALTDATPSVPGQHLLSYNGGTFLAQVNIGTLAPGAISLPVTLRRSIASNAQLGLWAMRVFAEATSWS